MRKVLGERKECSFDACGTCMHIKLCRRICNVLDCTFSIRVNFCRTISYFKLYIPDVEVQAHTQMSFTYVNLLQEFGSVKSSSWTRR